MPYPIITVPEDSASQLEQLGTKAKFWYFDGNRHMLFKVGRPDTGENWAEKVSSEICELIGLPHAHYELAKWREEMGVVTETFVPPDGRLILGNELLASVIKDYEKHVRYRSRQHTVRRVMVVMLQSWVEFPMNWVWPAAMECAADVFTGYLMLDALIGNQDRHHENWGFITADDQMYLAPTFDHASSLGRNETDENRLKRLRTKDKGYGIEMYVTRAVSALFENPTSTKPLTTLDAFAEAAKIRPEAGRYWKQVLRGINHSAFIDILSQLPAGTISDAGIEFALKMIEANTNRILETGN